MPASSTQYGTTLPSGSDPYPIESVLAKIVGENNPAEAANMLDVYQTQRAADTGNYNYALGQQHDFAQQQLHQQLLENYMKYGQEALKTPGGATLLGAQTGGAALAGFDPTQIETNLRVAQAASTAKDVGTAAYQGLEGGLATDPALATAASGGLFSGSTVPLALQKEAMVQSGANARHSADASPFGIKLSASLTSSPETGSVPLTASLGKNASLADPRVQKYLADRGVAQPKAPQALPDTGSGAPSSKTSLTPAPTARATPSSAASGSDIRQRVEQHVENNLRIGTPQQRTAYTDITAGRVGGKVNIVGTAPDGRPIIQGKSGQQYVP